MLIYYLIYIYLMFLKSTFGWCNECIVLWLYIIWLVCGDADHY